MPASTTTHTSDRSQPSHRLHLAMRGKLESFLTLFMVRIDYAHHSRSSTATGFFSGSEPANTDDRIDVLMVGAAAAAQHRQVRQLLAQETVLQAELVRI